MNTPNDSHALADQIAITTPGDVGGTWYVKDSSFKIFASNGHHEAHLGWDIDFGQDPIAGAISRITVESMKYFPTDSNLYDGNPGALGKKPN
jgi:hypothetical protein